MKSCFKVEGMMQRSLRVFLLGVVVFQFSCNAHFQPQSIAYSNTSISADKAKSPQLETIIFPYADSVNKSMNQVVGINADLLEKKQPSSTLGNFVADAMLYSAKEKYSFPIDAAVVNYGGIRINQLPAGNITKGKIFELMPFDNWVVVQKINGEKLQQFLNLIAAKGGWPLAGISMGIENKKAINIKVNGQALEFSKTYTLVNSDYIANGGDNADMLRSIPQLSVGYLMRDAIFDYIKSFQQRGKAIEVVEEKRIVHVE